MQNIILMLFLKTISCCKVYNLNFMTIGPFFHLPILHLWIYMHAVVWSEYKLLRGKDYVKKCQKAPCYDKYFEIRLYAYKNSNKPMDDHFHNESCGRIEIACNYH